MRIGLLGASRIAELAVVQPAARRPDVTVAVVAARDPQRAGAYAQVHGIPAVASDYEALLARDDLDLVYISLPNAAHAPWSIRALERGHAVLCEKPLGLDAGEVRVMQAAAHVAGRLLLEGFAYRHHALMRDVVRRVRGGDIGRVRRAEAGFVQNPAADKEVRWSRALGASALLNLGGYAVHALRSVLGEEPQVVSARGGFREDVNAWAEGRLAFPGGVEARVECSHVADRIDAWLRFEGDDGVLEVENFVAPQLPHRLAIRHGADEEAHTFTGPGSYDAQMAHVVEVMAGRAAPLTGGEDALRTAETLDALDRLARAAAVPA